MFKHTEKVDFNEVHTPNKKGKQTLNEAGEPKVMVTANTSDSVTFLIGTMRYTYRGLTPPLISTFSNMVKSGANFRALNWLKARVPIEQRFKVVDGKEMPIEKEDTQMKLGFESKVNEDYRSMDDAELLAWFKEEKAKRTSEALIATLAREIEARGLKTNEAKEDNKSYIVFYRDPESDNQNGEYEDITIEANSSKEAREKALKELGKGYKIVSVELDEAAASGGFKKDKDEEPNEDDRDESPYHKLYAQSQEKDKKVAEKTDTPNDPSFGSVIRAKGLAARTPGLPAEEPSKEIPYDKIKQRNQEVEDFEHSWSADNSKVPNESKVSEGSGTYGMVRIAVLDDDELNNLGEMGIQKYLDSGRVELEGNELWAKEGDKLMKKEFGNMGESKVDEIAVGMTDKERKGYAERKKLENLGLPALQVIQSVINAPGIGTGGFTSIVNYIITHPELIGTSESKVNEDDFMNGGATTSNDKGGVNFAPDQANPPTVDDTATKMDKEEEGKSTKDKVSDDSGKEEKEESKEGEKEYLGNNGADQYFYLYQKPAEGVDESKVNEDDIVGDDVTTAPLGNKAKANWDGPEVNTQSPTVEPKAVGESTEKYTTSSDTSGQPANAKAAAEDVRKSAAHEKAQTGKGQVTEGTDYDKHHKEETEIEDLQILNAEDEVVFSAKKNDIDTTDIKKFLMAALKDLAIANVSYDIVLDYLLPEPETTPETEEPSEEEYPYAQGEPELAAAQESKTEGLTMDKELLEKFGLTEGTTPVSTDPAETGAGANSEYVQNKDDVNQNGANEGQYICTNNPPDNTPLDPTTDDSMDESLMLKYGFMSESTAKLFEKFGLIIDEANGINEKKIKCSCGYKGAAGTDDEEYYVCPECGKRAGDANESKDESYYKEQYAAYNRDISDSEEEMTYAEFKKNLIDQEKTKVNEEDLSTPSTSGVPGIPGVAEKDMPTNPMANKGPGMVETPGQHMNLTNEAKWVETKGGQATKYSIKKGLSDHGPDAEFEKKQKEGFAWVVQKEADKGGQSFKFFKTEAEAGTYLNSIKESKINEDGEVMPDQASGDIVPPAQDVTPPEAPLTADGNVVADSGEQTMAEDYSTPDAARAQIAIDYPEEPLTTTAMVFADSFINDPAVYKSIRKMQWEGLYTDAEGIVAQSKIVGDYRNFTPEVVKLLTDRLGNGAKYKLGRNNGPTITMVLRDPDFSISLSGLKELVKAQEVTKTGEPGEVILKF